jgi:hypothetical protein
MNKIILLLCTALLVSSCNQRITREVVTEPKQVIIKEIISPPEVYFCPRDNCSSRLEALIKNAGSVKCAFYDLELENVVMALQEKDNVSVVVDDNSDIGGLWFIRKDNHYQLSHNKFCVFDDKVVWTGSFNPTTNGDNKNNNNVVVYNSRYLADNYKEEFEELWNSKFGEGAAVRYPVMFLNNKKLENYFCPEDDCKGNIIKTLENAKESIYFMAFSFTDKDIADLLINKKNLGVDVKGVFEKQRINMKSNEYRYIKEKGVDVRYDSNAGIMHHKVFVVDNETVITGSYNPTKNGNERNDENILIIQDKEVAGMFLEEFQYIYTTGE